MEMNCKVINLNMPKPDQLTLIDRLIFNCICLLKPYFPTKLNCINFNANLPLGQKKSNMTVLFTITDTRGSSMKYYKAKIRYM